MSARGSGRVVEPLAEDADTAARAPFTDPASWEPWARRLVSLPVKVALEAHGALVKFYGHAGVVSCPCTLALAARQAWEGL